MEVQLHAQSLDQPLSSTTPAWVVVDMEICRKELASIRDDDRTTTAAEARASNGELVRVSFALHALPGASRLRVHCQEGRELSCFDTILAAHGDAVLFRLEVDYKGLPPARYAVDYFIYRAASPHGAVLSLLPRCYSTEKEVDAAAVGSWRRNPRLAPAPGRNSGTGLLLVGDDGGDFVVAELHLELARLEGDAADAPLEAQLFRLRSGREAATAIGAGEWEVKHARARGGKAKFRDLLCCWRAHAVVGYGDYLCWVDYSRGVIFCDVIHQSPDLQYLALPVEHIPFGYPDPCRIGWPEASRAVCVTGSGRTMKFINVARSDGMLSGKSDTGSDFTITISTLVHRGYDDMGWEEDATIEATQLWGMEGYSDKLPQVALQFPLLNMDDPNIIYFVLEWHTLGAGAKAWVVALDMDSCKVLWYKDIKATPDDEDAETAPYNIFCNLPFFPTEFSKHLRNAEPPAASEETSKHLDPNSFLREK